MLLFLFLIILTLILIITTIIIITILYRPLRPRHPIGLIRRLDLRLLCLLRHLGIPRYLELEEQVPLMVVIWMRRLLERNWRDIMGC